MSISNKLSIPMIVGIMAFIYGVFYTTLPIIVLRDGFQGDFSKLVNFILLAFGALLVLLGSPAIMLKWDWGRKISSNYLLTQVDKIEIELLI
jgi:hypothetical protein